jgi:putative ABC transport system substrate-binding protein
MVRRLTLVAVAGLVLSASNAGADERAHRIGVLVGGLPDGLKKPWEQGLRERGWLVGGNLLIEYRYYGGLSKRIPVYAAELAALGLELIVVGTSEPALALHSAAPTTPLVFASISDPVALGLVENLAHPGGSVTGVTSSVPEGFNGKQLQLLKELVPRASRIAVLINPKNPLHQRSLAEPPEIGERLEVALVVVEASAPDQFETAFDVAIEQGTGAIQIWGDPLTTLRSKEIVALAARHRLPAGYLFRQSVLDGGLFSLGPDQAERWRRVGVYVDKILRGERPADLPVEQPTKYELVVNLKTAAELGITVPPLILAEADEVIE